MAGGPVYRDCAVKSKTVLLTRSIHPEFHPTTLGTTRDECYSAELEYVVDSKGLVETKTARVVRSNSDALAQALMSILPQWRFQPAMLNEQPVRQIVIDRQVVMTRVVVARAGTTPAAPSGTRQRVTSC